MRFHIGDSVQYRNALGNWQHRTIIGQAGSFDVWYVMTGAYRTRVCPGYALHRVSTPRA
jgi:hypothetical protein